MSVERHLHRCDVTITASGWTFKGVEETEDMYTSVDKVMDKIERQIRRMKGREQDRKGTGSESIREGVGAVPAEGGEVPEAAKHVEGEESGGS
jgi:putative sigma-54 modulation protein